MKEGRREGEGVRKEDRKGGRTEERKEGRKDGRERRRSDRREGEGEQTSLTAPSSSSTFAVPSDSRCWAALTSSCCLTSCLRIFSTSRSFSDAASLHQQEEAAELSHRLLLDATSAAGGRGDSPGGPSPSIDTYRAQRAPTWPWRPRCEPRRPS